MILILSHHDFGLIPGWPYSLTHTIFLTKPGPFPPFPAICGSTFMGPIDEKTVDSFGIESSNKVLYAHNTNESQKAFLPERK